MISLEYHETIMAPSGHAAEKSKKDVLKNHKGKYIAIVEGAIPMKDEALDWQRDVIRMQALLGAKNPHPQTFLVGGMSIPIDPNSQNAINAGSLAFLQSLAKKALEFVQKVYIPDLPAVASFYKEWASIGGGVGNYLSHGEFQNDNLSNTKNCWLSSGFIRNKKLSQ